MESFKKLFPVRNNNHDMEKRKAEKFYVKFANTERYKKSAIPAMQRALNKEVGQNEKIVTREHCYL